jgi:hypothetical protein
LPRHGAILNVGGPLADGDHIEDMPLSTRRDPDEHREAGIALDEGGDVRVVRSGKKVSFPNARKDTTTVVAALAKHIRKLPKELRRSLIWDQGKEMHAHKRFTVATNVQVYFCEPRSPWQRGSNENTNGLLRQYPPRGTDFSRFSQSLSERDRSAAQSRSTQDLGLRNASR